MFLVCLYRFIEFAEGKVVVGVAATTSSRERIGNPGLAKPFPGAFVAGFSSWAGRHTDDELLVLPDAGMGCQEHNVWCNKRTHHRTLPFHQTRDGPAWDRDPPTIMLWAKSIVSESASVSMCLVLSREILSEAEEGVPVATPSVSMAKSTELVVFLIFVVVVVILGVVLTIGWENRIESNRIDVLYCSHRCGRAFSSPCLYG